MASASMPRAAHHFDLCAHVFDLHLTYNDALYCSLSLCSIHSPFETCKCTPRSNLELRVGLSITRSTTQTSHELSQFQRRRRGGGEPELGLVRLSQAHLRSVVFNRYPRYSEYQFRFSHLPQDDVCKPEKIDLMAT